MMSKQRRENEVFARKEIVFIEPGSRPGRPFNPWMSRRPLFRRLVSLSECFTAKDMLPDGCFDGAIARHHIDEPAAGRQRELTGADSAATPLRSPR